MRFQHIAAVQERHLAILLHPHLVPRVRRNDAQRCDVETEFPGFCEFSEADSQGEQVVARDACGEVGEGFTDVVDAGALVENVSNLGIIGGAIFEEEGKVPGRGRRCGRSRQLGRR